MKGPPSSRTPRSPRFFLCFPPGLVLFKGRFTPEITSPGFKDDPEPAAVSQALGIEAVLNTHGEPPVPHAYLI
jgi:hypothetical protein